MLNSNSHKTRLSLSLVFVFLSAICIRAQCGAPIFNVAQTFAVGDGPHAIAGGDFNGDGHGDVVTANFFANTISLLLGNGSGGFGPAAMPATVGTQPRAIATGDFNGDTKTDLVVANFGSHNISVLLGDGSGSFSISTLAGEINPRSIVVADFNNDNKQDFAVANQSGSVSIFLGNGAGAFASTTVPVTSSLTAVTSADLNHDNKADLIVTTPTSPDVRVLLGNGDGTFGAATGFGSFSQANSLAVADFNGDTHADLAVGTESGTVYRMLGNGSGGFGSGLFLNQGNRISSILAMDLSGDGKADFVATDYVDDFLTVFVSKGDGSFEPTAYFATGSQPHAVVASDLNHDNKLDVIVANLFADNVVVLTGNGTGTFNENVEYDAGRGPEALVVGDFNNDGRDDVAVAGYFHVSVFLNTISGRLLPAQFIDLSGSPAGIATSDFNNDGNLDLVTADQATNRITLLQGNPNGNFSSAGTFNTGFNPVSVTTGDFNEDGNSDVAVANRSGNNIAVLIGNGSGGFAPAVTYPAGTSPLFITAADLNNDGRYDLIAANENSNELTIYLGNGTGTFNSSVNVPAATPRTVAVGDLNGDGNNDLAVGNGLVPSNLTILFGNGTGGFTPSGAYTVVFTTSSIAIADFNGDNKPDLAVGDLSTSTVAVLLNSGNGTFGSPTNFSRSGVGAVVAVGDFNKDGAHDLAVANDADLNSPLGILQNKCATIPTSPPSLLINNVSVDETDAAGVIATFTVSLSNASNRTVSVSYAVGSGTAKKNIDFSSVGGRFVFAPGQLTKTIEVAITGDIIDEFDETFSVLLHDSLHAPISDGSGSGTINDNDPPPNLLLSDASALEGNSGTKVVNLVATLSVFSEKPISISFATQAQTATADSDYVSASGILTIPINTSSVFLPVTVKGDTVVETDETLLVTLADPTNVTISDGQGQVTILNDDAELRFSAGTYSIAEDAGSLNVTIERIGYPNSVLSVRYATTDTDNFTINCSQASGGNAFARCDFATSIDTVIFGPGETSKTFEVPIINDAIAEGNETFGVVLSNVTGASLGSPSTTTITINDNDAADGPNPIFTTPFFVRQHYLDFLSREPEPTEPWTGVLNGCSDVNNNPDCDRVTVSGAFFGSPEFQLKGYFVYRLYKLAFNRLPLYTEIVVDMRAVTGATDAEVFQKKATFTNNFVLRPEFGSLNAMTNTQYVSTLMGRYGLTSITTPDPANPDGINKVTLTSTDLISRLNAATLTRAKVLRAIADSDQVFNTEFNQGFVAMQYFGYLRRNPDTAGYNAWLNYLNTHPGDSRTMVNGFMNSTEYRLRFGPPTP